MANKTPHVVGGGLGTFRKEAQERHDKAEKARQQAERKAALARIAKAR